MRLSRAGVKCRSESIQHLVFGKGVQDPRGRQELLLPCGYGDPVNGVDWKGRWIFKAGEKRPTNYYLLLRRSFQLDFHVVSASVAVSADAFYKLYINGNYVGRGPARSSDKKKFYDRYDITTHLRRGGRGETSCGNRRGLARYAGRCLAA